MTVAQVREQKNRPSKYSQSNPSGDEDPNIPGHNNACTFALLSVCSVAELEEIHPEYGLKLSAYVLHDNGAYRTLTVTKLPGK